MEANNLVKVLGVLLLVTITGCYPEGLETREETDLVVTDYNTAYDFSTINTYFLVDEIDYIGQDDPTRAWDEFILSELERNFEEINYTRMPVYNENSPPDVVVTVSILEILHVDIYSYGWYGWGWYGYYWYYPWYYGYDAVSYETGTVIWNLWEPGKVLDDEKLIQVEHSAIINGLLGSSSQVSRSRITEAIDQAFRQSPYLKGN